MWDRFWAIFGTLIIMQCVYFCVNEINPVLYGLSALGMLPGTFLFYLDGFFPSPRRP